MMALIRRTFHQLREFIFSLPCFTSMESEEISMEKILNDQMISSVRCPQMQRLPFHQSLMNYILDNADSDVLEKMALSCKYFYFIYPKLIQSIRFRLGNVKPLAKMHNKYWVQERLTVISINQCGIHSISQVIGRCTAKTVILKEAVSFADFKLLMKAQTVEKFECRNILKSNGKMVPLEDVMAEIPNAIEIAITGALITDKTIEKLKLLKFNNKFTNFCMIFYGDDFDFLQFFYEFLTKKIVPGAVIKLNAKDKAQSEKITEQFINEVLCWNFEKEPPIAEIWWYTLESEAAEDRNNRQRRSFSIHMSESGDSPDLENS